MKTWTLLTGDADWTIHAMWYKRAKDGAYFVLQFLDLVDAGGDDFANTPYECQVKRIHLDEIPESEINKALDSCGHTLNTDGIDATLCILEACIQYGLGAPLFDTSGKRAAWVRAEARREAESMMRAESYLTERLDRPVNAIGTTARNYGVGNLGL